MGENLPSRFGIWLDSDKFAQLQRLAREIEISIEASLDMILSNKEITKTLIRLGRLVCALVVRKPRSQVFLFRGPFTHGLLSNFVCIVLYVFVICWFFSKTKKKDHSFRYSQTVRLQIRLVEMLSSLIWIQIVCKVYKQMTCHQQAKS